MATHTIHPRTGALFHVGCYECEHRVALGAEALLYMDPDRVELAFLRAAALDLGLLDDDNSNELEVGWLRSVIWPVMVAMERTVFNDLVQPEWLTPGNAKARVRREGVPSAR